MTTLEKVRKLERYLAIRSPGAEAVIDQTIDKLLDREKARLLEIQATLRSQLGEFEKKYSMTTADFCVRFQRGELGDDMDFMEWSATSDMLKSTEKHLPLLEEEIGNEPAH